MSTHQSAKKITVPDILDMKKRGEKIAALTAYDYLMAELLDEAGMDIILVGDSAGMVVAGNKTTLPISMEEMLYHTRMVSKGVKKALLVADMPFLSYQVSISSGIENAGRFLKEAGAEAVKVEGGKVVAELVSKLVDYGIPVMGHLGLTPQSINKFGSYKLQGAEEKTANILKRDANLLEEAGVFSLVLEKVPANLAKDISESISIPTIGIGAGPFCDGQVLVSHDMLGLFDKFKPKFVRRYASLGEDIRKAFGEYIRDVKNSSFPNPDESF
jgi:3-methyl-2-oxobutanoate hydroxymethyltransferase